MAHILITGGTGFIGSHIVENLLNTQHQITVLTTSSGIHPNIAPFIDKIKLVRGSFGDQVLMEQLLTGVDYLIHLAWSSVPKVASDNPAYDAQTNVIGGIYLLQAAVKTNVKKIIFISTGGALYGIPQYTPIDEQHPLRPISAYGISKMSFERYLHFFFKNHQLDYTILRVANAYGTRQNLTKGQGVIGIWLDKIRKNDTIEIWGDGTIIRDYIYVADIAKAVVKAVDYQGKRKVFNLGAGKGYSLNQILETCQKIYPQKLAVSYLAGRSFDVPINVLDITKIQQEFDWHPTTSLTEGLRATWEWLEGEE